MEYGGVGRDGREEIICKTGFERGMSFLLEQEVDSTLMTESNVLQLKHMTMSSVLASGKWASMTRVHLQQLLSIVYAKNVLYKQAFQGESLRAFHTREIGF